MRGKLYLNTIASLLYQIISIVSGLILPRMILITFGSTINGIVSSMTQMLGFISLLDLGVGAVVQTAFYKPLLKKDIDKVSDIYHSASKYFKLVAKILIIYILILIVYYGLFNNSNYTPFFTTTLILAISISSFAQYYFGICNSILLNADQKAYIPIFINTITLIINTVLSIILMILGFNIQIVKLVSSLIFILRPVLLNIYVKRNYTLIYKNEISKNVLPNKWSGMIQHFSTVITNSSNSILLTIFSTFTNVSIYNIYVLPLNSIKSLLESMCTGYKSYFGKIYAQNNLKKLNKEFNIYETISHYLTVIIFSIIYKTLVPFVMVYTIGVNDINYSNYVFATLITLAYAVYSLRLPYTTIIFSAGKFKETQLYCLIECFLNIILSIMCIELFGLNGVAIGTISAVSYRIIASVYYLKKDIIYRKLNDFIKLIIIDVLTIFVILCSTYFFKYTNNSIVSWIIYAFKISIISLIITTTMFYLLIRDFRNIIDVVLNKIKNII